MSKVIHSKIDLMKIHITTLLLFYENDDAANYDDVGGGKVWAGQVLFPSNSDHRRVGGQCTALIILILIIIAIMPPIYETLIRISWRQNQNSANSMLANDGNNMLVVEPLN